MNHRNRIVAGIAALAATALAAASTTPASADTSTQTITAATAGMVSISTNPTASVDFGTMTLGANTASAGQLGVGANVAYTVTVAGQKAKLTKYANSAYDDATTLSSAMLVLTTLSTGAGVPVASVPVGTSAVQMASGTGLTTDVFSLQLSQTVLPTDPQTTFRNVLTYTASQVL